MERFNLKNSLEFCQVHDVEAWVHAFLRNDGGNVPFSDGLKLEERSYIGPMTLSLNLFERCCGPEAHMKYIVDRDGFENYIGNMIKSFESGWEMPPLIINYSKGKFELNDGNHRFEALCRCNIQEYPVVIWTTGEEDKNQFIKAFENYLRDK